MAGIFGADSDRDLTLEIGSYHGESLIEMAANHPERLFIGIEWRFRECFKAVEKAQRRGLKNLVFLRANVARLPYMFTPGELDQIWILFPDPWPKFGHMKWRVLHADFFRTLGLLLDPGKNLIIKTDHSDYAASISYELREAGCFAPVEESFGDELLNTFPITPFERIFQRNNSAIFRFPLVRNLDRVVSPAPLQDIFAVT